MFDSNPKDLQDFSDLEKEALKEISLDIIKSDLQQSLGQLHQENMEDVGNKISEIKQQCVREIKEGLEKHIKDQLEQHFQKMLVSYQDGISKVLSFLFKRVEEDALRLNDVANQTHNFCKNIQRQYAFKWDSPYLTLILSTAATGALIGLGLLFLQIPFISALLMNEHTRKAYDIGVRVLEYEQELQARPVPVKKSENQKKKKASK
ncbi:MAG: hypothetical protein BGO67_04080 [Alphaproteobacteria bacterium 41-28]|nr:MAG: hypothetical protein BGO67_04080 [Alphaproteobacteria bacterium 41-28]